MSDELKRDCASRLHAVEERIRDMTEMFDRDEDRAAVLAGVSAILNELSSVEEALIRNHADTCVQRAIASDDAVEQRQKIAELIEAMRRLRR